MGKIRVAIIGVGNCASSLIHGIEYYKNTKDTDKVGLMNQAPTRESIPTAFYSTVTLFARFLGWSTSAPLIAPM